MGSINLSEFVGNKYTPNAFVDYDSLSDAICTAVEALDTIIDENYNNHALKEQADNSVNFRNIGLGVMGYSNMLFKLGLKYGSDEAIKFTDNLFDFIFNWAVYASNQLAKNKGSFPKCKPDLIVKSTIMQNATTSMKNEIVQHGLRNCSLLSIAPNGSIATMLNGLTGGCEPEFALSYTRKTDNLKDSYEVYCQSVQEYFDTIGEPVDMDKLPDYFVTSKDIAWKDRVRTQAVMQKYIDTAISSTVNLPNETTMEEIEQIYLEAWKQGLKGITVYRAGCGRGGILVEGGTEEKTEKVETTSAATKKELPRGYTIDADDCAIGKKRKLTTGCGSLHCSAFFDPVTGELLETYLSKGSTGGCNNFMIGLSRMISLSARAGVPIESIIDQLNSCGSCPSYAVRKATKHDTSKGSCCPIAIGYALKEMYDEMQNDLFGDDEIDDQMVVEYRDTATITGKPKHKNMVKAACPECGEEITFEGGCNICKSCGWSKCD